MTVEEISGNEVTCVWFEGTKVNHQVFVAATLKPYQSPAVGAFAFALEKDRVLRPREL